MISFEIKYIKAELKTRVENKRTTLEIQIFCLAKQEATITIKAITAKIYGKYAKNSSPENDNAIPKNIDKYAIGNIAIPNKTPKNMVKLCFFIINPIC